MKKIISVVGTRPNFMKVAPLHKAFSHFAPTISHIICHTGQHYDENMSGTFFQDLSLPAPDYFLGAGSGSHAQQTARILVEFEKVLLTENPDLVIVPGDVNSTIACALAACKMGIKTAHIEAGLRSFDRSMPEEINRVLTDTIADMMFVTEPCGMNNLLREGVDPAKCFLVGNCMIDNLIQLLPVIRQAQFPLTLGLEDSRFCLLTLHRVSNVDDEQRLRNIIRFINDVASMTRVIFPVHPRTLKNLKQTGLLESFHPNIRAIQPASYVNFMSLLRSASFIISDSGGVQTEAMFFGTPCITLRHVTEHLVTVESGANFLIDDDFSRALDIASAKLQSDRTKFALPELWDGKASERIVKIIGKSFGEF